jgi:hypothetical protein
VSTDASLLYNAGTVALQRGELGEAVALLAAAERIDPRAADVRRNLALAQAQVAAGRGEDGAVPAPAGPIALSVAEAWWLAALLLAAAAALGALQRVRRPLRARRPVRGAALALLATGALLTLWLASRALEERAHPEAVVVAPILEARRGPDEPPRPPVLLRAGERIRLGRERGGAVEVRIGGSSIGWVPREGLWRVADAPRYTGKFVSR